MDTLNRTDIHGRPVIEQRAWSFSALDKFTNCARKYHHYDVLKDIKEPENPKMREGFKVHKVMADYIRDGTPLPKEYERFADWTTTMIKPGGVVLVEHRMACTRNLLPCAYFSKKRKVWCRAQADLLVMDGAFGLSVDWKTGSERDPKYDLLPTNFQLKLTALLAFLHFPDLQTIKSKYVYLYDGVATDFTVTRQELARGFIEQIDDLVGGFQHAFDTNQFPPRPSGLCKKHCAVASCQYWGKGY
jgi:hypothetical protein